MPKSPTARFSDRVENYVRYRPGYPAEVLELLRAECGLRANHVVADIASGTGIFTRLLLENGNSVFAVEPNGEMREMGRHQLDAFDRLVSVAGTAEETTLRSASVDFVTSAQAAHWFDLPLARAEFARILRPEGWCVLIWNERRTASTPFLQDYENVLLTYGTDYKDVRHERTTAMIHEFFAPTPYQERVFTLCQRFDYEGLAGRLLSSSYAPLEGHPSHTPMMQELLKLFRAHAKGGNVEFEYDTRVYYAQLR
ncbi:MAG TPA: class I SAM-dependent methyltransferase [Terriglobales bacterium]|jgi:SAM-dependent methyltransferase|nr:class I SAM-dependent methyltransferase [Terriglobales bacterium]